MKEKQFLGSMNDIFVLWDFLILETITETQRTGPYYTIGLHCQSQVIRLLMTIWPNERGHIVQCYPDKGHSCLMRIVDMLLRVFAEILSQLLSIVIYFFQVDMLFQNYTKFYRHLYHFLFSSEHVSESFHCDKISAILNSDIILSGGHAFWKF